MQRRTIDLSEKEREELIDHRDHDTRPYVRERCAAVIKVADGQAPRSVALHGLLKSRDPDTGQTAQTPREFIGSGSGYQNATPEAPSGGQKGQKTRPKRLTALISSILKVHFHLGF